MTETAWLENMRSRAGLAVSEMAQWCDVGYSTMYGWMRRGIVPAPFKIPLLIEKMGLLDNAIDRGLLPIPLSVKQAKRAVYLRELKDGYNTGVPEARLTREWLLSCVE